MERQCRAIGRKVALVVNYDGLTLDPAVSDAYFSMVTYMESRYYASASRYTTSASAIAATWALPRSVRTTWRGSTGSPAAVK